MDVDINFAAAYIVPCHADSGRLTFLALVQLCPIFIWLSSFDHSSRNNEQCPPFDQSIEKSIHIRFHCRVFGAAIKLKGEVRNI